MGEADRINCADLLLEMDRLATKGFNYSLHLCIGKIAVVYCINPPLCTLLLITLTDIK